MDYVHRFTKQGDEFFQEEFKKMLLQFRNRKSLNWANTEIDELSYDPPKVIHGYSKEGTRLSIKLTDGERSTTYTINVVQLNDGWFPFIFK